KKTGNDFALARYNSDGSLDTTFNKSGKVTTDFAGSSSSGTDDQAFAVAIQGDGKIVAAGESAQPGFDFALARYNSDASLDKGVGNGGQVIPEFGGISQAVGVAIQADGNIVAAGTTSQPGTGFDFALARYIGVSPSQPIETIIANVQALVSSGVLNNGQGN